MRRVSCFEWNADEVWMHHFSQSNISLLMLVMARLFVSYSVTISHALQPWRRTSLRLRKDGHRRGTEPGQSLLLKQHRRHTQSHGLPHAPLAGRFNGVSPQEHLRWVCLSPVIKVFVVGKRACHILPLTTKGRRGRKWYYTTPDDRQTLPRPQW